MNRKIKKILTSSILLLVCTTLVFFAMGSETANAWSPPGIFGPSDINSLSYKYSYPQQSSIPVYNTLGTYTASGFNFGATHWHDDILETDRWQTRSKDERYAVYMMTAQISDELYYALMRGTVSLTTNASSVFENDDGLYLAYFGMKSFVSIGSITGTGLEWNSFSATRETYGSAVEKDFKNSSSNVSTSASLGATSTNARYIRYGISLKIKSNGDGLGWVIARARIRNISFSLTIAANDYFVGNVSSAENSADFLLREDINAYFRNQGNLNGTSVSGVVGNANYGIMENGMSSGSSMGPIAPITPTITAQQGTSPSMNSISISEGSYSNGVFTPTSPSYSLPTFAGIGVTDLSLPSVLSTPSVLSVQDSNITHSIPNALEATPASATGNIVIDTFEAKEPADPYRWKNPATLDESLSQPLIEGDGYTYEKKYLAGEINHRHTYNFYKSGLMNFTIDHGIEGWADEVRILFTTNDQDMHIVLAEGQRITWGNDKDSKMEILGDGKVFIYLMGNNSLYFDADYWTVGDGNYIGTSEREEHPRLFFIGIGGNINMDFLKINSRIAIYMPHGRTAEFSPGPNRVRFVSNSEEYEINGLVVTDLMEFGVEDKGKFTFYRYYDPESGKYRSGLPESIYFAGENRPLNYFLQDPAAEASYANYKWRNTGIYYN